MPKYDDVHVRDEVHGVCYILENCVERDDAQVVRRLSFTFYFDLIGTS